MQAFRWLVVAGRVFLRSGLPPIRSDWWTLDTVGDCGILGRVRDLASRGRCSFLSSDLQRHTTGHYTVQLVQTHQQGKKKLSQSKIKLKTVDVFYV